MGVERTIYCDGPSCADQFGDDCDTAAHVTTATPPPYLPLGTIETREQLHGKDTLHHFCSWDCLMKFAARQPLAETIPIDGGTDV